MSTLGAVLPAAQAPGRGRPDTRPARPEAGAARVPHGAYLALHLLAAPGAHCAIPATTAVVTRHTPSHRLLRLLPCDPQLRTKASVAQRGQACPAVHLVTAPCSPALAAVWTAVSHPTSARGWLSVTPLPHVDGCQSPHFLFLREALPGPLCQDWGSLPAPFIHFTSRSPPVPRTLRGAGHVHSLPLLWTAGR